jgi:flagellar biosynthesis/type III secretory pathway protein FliH
VNPPSETIQFTAPLRDVRIVDERERERRFAEQLREHYERGVRDGERKLSEQLVKQRSEVMELKNGALHSLSQAMPGVINECQDALVALALQVAQKMVAGMPITVEMVEGSVREALAEMEDAASYVVQLNPADLQLLEQYDSALRKNATEEHIEFQALPEMSRGGCVVKSQFGVVDAQRETKMALLEKTLQG